MQKCSVCGAPFKWNKIFKSIWLGYEPVQCEKCNSKYKITFTSRLICVSLIILPMLIFGFYLTPLLISNKLYINLLLLLIIPIVCSLFSPYLVKYKKVDT